MKIDATQLIIAAMLLAGLCTSAELQAKPVEDESLPKPQAIRLAIEDLAETYGERYPGADEYLKRLDRLESMPEDEERTDALRALRREALLANPLLDFDKVLMIRRKEKDVSDVRRAGGYRWRLKLGISNNFNGKVGIPEADDRDNAIVTLENYRDEPVLKEVFRPERSVLVADMDLHWDAERLLFASLDEAGHWHIYEVGMDGTGLRKVTPDELSELDVDSYSPCYLPDERIIFVSTVTEQTVPCTGGDQPIGNLCRMNPNGTAIRRLCFDQDQNWTPVVSNQGAVLYTRWQYSDQAHRYPRILMRMNPDGTNQQEYYGSGSYWPNSLFYVRPIPGHASRFVGIVTGHHGVPRMGEMILFDRKLGQRESVDNDRQPAPGVVQRITDRGETVDARISDKYADNSWPKFLYPYPLDGKYFLASARPTPDSSWGVYLVDVFDNMVLLHEEPGQIMFEPVPVKPRARPPVVPDQVDLERKDATVYISDIYEGPGLKGVPRGVVKDLQLYTFSFPPFYEAKRRNVSTTNALGIASVWDIHAVMGRVPVETDGSARFTVPANTPISLQPLDEEGKAVQIMRAWFTAMPGESVSCVGCHEQPDTAPPPKLGDAFERGPSKIRPWHGATRPFDFRREVQPVLDRRCVGCHDGSKADRPDLRSVRVDESVKPMRKGSRVLPQDFSWAYYNLQRYVWRPTGESEMAVLMPMEHHADTSELVQMLRKGHHGVELTEEEWDRIVTWIDMNAPFYGSWQDAPRTANPEESLKRRRKLLQRFANVDWDLGRLPKEEPASPEFVRPEPVEKPEPARMDGWPLSDAEGLQNSTAESLTRTISLGPRHELTMVWIPPGSLLMGSRDETPDERPMAPVKIKEGFWMSSTEVSNRTYGLFDPDHHSRYINQTTESMWSKHLRSLNEWDQPVVRISWDRAQAFCRWLSEHTGEEFLLPTEAQWEWAARAGSDRGFPEWTRGETKGIANCAGVTWGNFYSVRKSLSHRLWNPDWDDEQVETDKVTANAPNPWGLKNMHGNAAEWTRSLYRPYPYEGDDGRNDPEAEGKRVVRGGSFSDRPKRCTASYRLGYHPWQGVYNVGFRVVSYGKNPLREEP